MYAVVVCNTVYLNLAVSKFHLATAYDDVAFCGMSFLVVNAYVIYGFVEQFNAAYNDVHLAMLLAGAVKDENGCVVAIKVQEAVLIGVNPLYCSEAFVFVARVLAVEVEELLKVFLHCPVALGGC